MPCTAISSGSADTETNLAFSTPAQRYRMSDHERYVWVDDGGNKRVCTELFNNGLVDRKRYIADVAYCRHTLSEITLRGYRLWGPACASLMRRHPWFLRAIAVPTRWFIEESAFHMSLRTTRHWPGWFVRHALFVPVCWSIGMMAGARQRVERRRDDGGGATR